MNRPTVLVTVPVLVPVPVSVMVPVPVSVLVPVPVPVPSPASPADSSPAHTTVIQLQGPGACTGLNCTTWPNKKCIKIIKMETHGYYLSSVCLATPCYFTYCSSGNISKTH